DIKLRGIYSQGLLVPCPDPSWPVGKDVREEMRIGKWEPPVDTNMAGEMESPPGHVPVYDIEGYGRYNHLLPLGTDVTISEKLHGANARYLFKDGRIWCSSRNHFWK